MNAKMLKDQLDKISHRFTNTRFLLTTDSQETLDFHTELELKEPPSAESSGVHQEIRLVAKSGTQTCDPLEVFDNDELRRCISKQLVSSMASGPSVCAIYTDDNACLVRIPMSDVGFLHELRDRILMEEFESVLTQGLLEAKAAKRKPDVGDWQVVVDQSHFIEIYESTILNLDKLTSHRKLRHLSIPVLAAQAAALITLSTLCASHRSGEVPRMRREASTYPRSGWCWQDVHRFVHIARDPDKWASRNFHRTESRPLVLHCRVAVQPLFGRRVAQRYTQPLLRRFRATGDGSRLNCGSTVGAQMHVQLTSRHS